MRWLLGLLVIGLLGMLLTACGGASKDAGGPSPASSVGKSQTTGTTSATTPANTPPAPVETKVDGDKDNDVGAPADDTNNNQALDFGHAASPSEASTITALIKRYYAAAGAEDGVKACSMIYSTLEESVAEDYGRSPPGQTYMLGNTCPAVLRLLFKHFHPQIALELPKLKVARVRLIEHHGIVILHFGGLSEREIPVTREGHTWKLAGLLDSEVP
jgi:hypothetical protein